MFLYLAFAMSARTWTDADFIKAVKTSVSVAGVLRILNLHPTGANYGTVKHAVRKLGLNTSHWTGSGHNKGQQSRNQHNKTPLSSVLVEHSTYARHALKERLLLEGLLKNECAICGILPFWRDQPMVLILDHINGVNDDARLDNLRLLCPNCNSQQPTFAARNRQGNKPHVRYSCQTCGKVLSQKRPSGKCVKCVKRPCTPTAEGADSNPVKCQFESDQGHQNNKKPRPTKASWPSTEVLAAMVWIDSALTIAKRLGVSSVAVKKRCARLGLSTPSRGYWAKLRAQ